MSRQNQLLYLQWQSKVASKIEGKGDDILGENLLTREDIGHRKVERMQPTMFVVNLLGRRLIPTILESVAHKNIHAIIKLVVSQILQNK